MTVILQGPFRADHVGSFLRPEKLKEARQDFSNNKITKEQLPYLEITENPAKDYGERIFNVDDVKEKWVIAKFHVRNDYKP